MSVISSWKGMKHEVTLTAIEPPFSFLSVRPTVHVLGLLTPRMVVAGSWPPDPGHSSTPGTHLAPGSWAQSLDDCSVYIPTVMEPSLCAKYTYIFNAIFTKDVALFPFYRSAYWALARLCNSCEVSSISGTVFQPGQSDSHPCWHPHPSNATPYSTWW